MDEARGSESSPLIDPASAEEKETSLAEQLQYAVDSFTAVIKPVAVTMVLASSVVTKFPLSNTSSSSSAGAYTVYATSGSDGAVDRVEKGFLNSLVIVGVLATATFGIVCLYKFKFMKLLIGYMSLSSVLLLGVMGGVLWMTVMELTQVGWDAPSFYLICYNFGVVGVVSIFYQKGVPTLVTQAYLVATSVLLAWQLSKFDEWTSWCLLVTLVAYDLCAVLTPCGPLKALVNLMQERQLEGGEAMPGLLYEASLPDSKLTSTYDEKMVTRSDDGDRESGAHGHRSEGESDRGEKRSIKLGLGDFVFYSVLVSRAASYGFAAACVCFLVIIAGLGATLVLLAVYKVALPALPISIALGVVFFFSTRFFLQGLIENLAEVPLYF